ncbi:MAG: HNH/endonuclease VII fold putative polymorphic toxin [Bacteroidota bacterium]
MFLKRAKPYKIPSKTGFTFTILAFLFFMLSTARGQSVKVWVNFNKFSPEALPWNNFSSDPIAGTTLTNLYDNSSQATGISVTLITDWVGVQNSGVNTGNNSGIYPDNVLKNFFRVYDDTETIRFVGLDPNTSYNFRFHSGRASDLNPYTEFEIDGNTVLADARYNSSMLVELLNIMPNAHGEIDVLVRNASGSSQGYLNGMEIEWSIGGGTPPIMPSNLNTVSTSGSAVYLTWTDRSNDETGFEIERSLTSGSGFTLITTTASDNTTYTDTGLSENTTYYYRIRAINTNGNSDYAPESTVTTPQSVPLSPSSLSITSSTSSSLTLSWADNSNNEDGFEIHRSLTSGSGFSLIQTTSADASSFTDTGLAPSTTYYYQVRAVNTAGASTFSSETQGSTDSGSAGTSGSTVLINFNKFSPEGGNWNNFNSDPVSGTALSNLLTSDGQATNFAVTLTSDWFGVSNSGINTGDNSGIFPDNVLKNHFRVYSDTETVEFSGLDVNNLYNFRLHSGRSSDLNPFTEFEINGNTVVSDARYNSATLVELTDITPDAQGKVVLYVRNATGSTLGYLNAMELEEMASSDPPNAPSQLSLAHLDQTLIALTWEDNSLDETGFSLERSETTGAGFVEIASLGADATAYLDEGLTENTTYYYRVLALGSSMSSDYSPVLEATTAEYVVPDTELIHKTRYNGSITAVKWRNHGDEEEKIFTYRYDRANRLTNAQFAYGVTNTMTGTWTSSVQGGFSVPEIGYDPNGNISTLRRQGMEDMVKTNDALSYAYTGNKLMSVVDLSGWDGFADKSEIGDDYSYDANGNLTSDANQGITSIIYNYMDLPERINKATGEYILYVYDASGSKLSEEIYDANNQLVKRTDYMGEFVFEDDALKLVHHEEGRVLPDATDGTFEYHYYLKDHLGNTRVTFTTNPKEIDFTLNYESNPAVPDDLGLFENVDNTTIISNDLFDHTDEAGNTYTNTQLLTGGLNSQVGSVIAIPVGMGDTLHAEVFAKYKDNNGNGNNSGAAIAGLLINAFTGGTGMTNELGNQSINNNFGSGSLIGTTGFAPEDANAPMAFLNVMFLPEDDVISLEKDVSFAYDQIDGAAMQPNTSTKAAHDRMHIDNFVAPDQGYVLVYLSNESAVMTEVYFDDLKITVNEHPVIQADSYYPFGSRHTGGFKRVTAKENRYLFGGKELQTDLDLGWLDFHARQYDPVIGRMLSVDPLTETTYEWTPYRFGFNNPVRYTDPTGMTEVDENGNVTYETEEEIGLFLAGYNKRYGGSSSTGENDGDCEGKDCDKKQNDNPTSEGLFSKKYWRWFVLRGWWEGGIDLLYPHMNSGSLGEDAEYHEKVEDMVITYATGKIISVVRIKRPGAFKKAKKAADIPITQQPQKVQRVPMTDSNGKAILDATGKPIMTREYTFTNRQGRKIVIQDHSAGHEFGDGGAGDQGSHFNVRPAENTRTGKVKGTDSHYPFDND